MVGVQSFELWASWSQTTRATSCATPRLILNYDYRSNMVYRNFPLRATGYRSETLSLCSLGALRIALCFFLFSHCLLPPPAAAMSESQHPDWYLWCLTILFYLSDKVNKNIIWNIFFMILFFVNSHKKPLLFWCKMLSFKLQIKVI